MAEYLGHILVVDDNLVNRRLLARALEEQGYSVTTAEHGRQALELLQGQPGAAIDVVLLDILMPELDGYQTLTMLQADPNLCHIPTIMISAVEEFDSVIRCVELGAADYLPKPFNPVLLRARVGACVEKKRLRDAEQHYLRGLRRELEIGREIQASFLPAALPQPPGWEIAARFQAAREVAGDFYDSFVLPDQTIGLVVADVCGKGVGAALFMTLVRSLLRAGSHLEMFTGRQYARAVGSSPELDSMLHDGIRLANNYIERIHGDTHMFATVFFGALDPASGLLRYVNAGHERPLVAGPSGFKYALKSTGPAIGLFPDVQFTVAQTLLEPGDTLLAFSDGVIDAKSAAAEFFSHERLVALLETVDDTARGLLDRIYSAVDLHTAGVEQFDDITMLAARRARPSE